MENNTRTYVKRYAVFDENVTFEIWDPVGQRTSQWNFREGDRIELDGKRQFTNEVGELIIVAGGHHHRLRRSSYHVDVVTETIEL
jgi:hypothetical protein